MPQSATPTFVLRVTNRSAVGATRVVVADRLAAGTTLISAQPSQGRCFTRGTRLLLCTLGDLDPRASATVRVRVQRQDTKRASTSPPRAPAARRTCWATTSPLPGSPGCDTADRVRRLRLSHRPGRLLSHATRANRRVGGARLERATSCL